MIFDGVFSRELQTKKVPAYQLMATITSYLSTRSPVYCRHVNKDKVLQRVAKRLSELGFTRSKLTQFTLTVGPLNL